MPIQTSLTTRKGTINHSGTAGMTITATREGSEVDTLIEYSANTEEEMREMICVLLCMLDERAGEKFVASCLSRYAEETGKKVLSEGDHKLVMIRGTK